MTKRREAGFTLIDMMLTLGILGVIVAIATPVIVDVSDALKLDQALREVEREMQTARLKAVTSNRPIRVRFNCPIVGQYRMVELIGTPAVPAAADTAASRCQEGMYPYPPADTNPLTRPNHDGPMRRLPSDVSFGVAATLEFWPDGSVHKQVAGEVPWKVVPTTGATVTLTKDSEVATITVNGLGKITLVQN